VDLLGRLATVFKTVAEAATVLGFFGFTISIILNSIAFAKIGVAFLQIATPSDIIISGVQVSTNLISGMTCIVVGLSVAEMLRRIPAKRAVIYFVSVVVMLILTFTLCGLISIFNQPHNYKSIPVYRIMLILILTPIVFWLSVKYYSNQRHSKYRKIGEWIAWATLATPIAILLLVIAVAYAYRLSEEGFLGNSVYLIEDGATSDRPRCGLQQVLWLGERAVVTRCETGKIVVIYQPQDLKIGPIELARPPALPVKLQAPPKVVVKAPAKG
jgi:hypothetical protein